MAGSKAKTVAAYLEELPADRRAQIAAVRKMVLKNLPKGYKESMCWGMICYSIPLSRYPDTYNKQPLAYVALAAQKNYNALYLTGCYSDPAQEKRLRDAFRSAGRKIDMGKSCLRFGSPEELPMEVLGELIAGNRPEDMIKLYEKSRSKPAERK